MPFAIAGGVIGAVGGVAGSLIQADAAKKGSSAAINAQREAQQQLRDDLSPWSGAGKNALMVSSDLAGANGPEAAQTAMKDFYTSPGYNWRLDQGLRGVDAGAAAKGMLRSGATLQAEQAFGEGLASSEFTDYYNRLFSLSNLGENAAAGVGASGVATGRGIAATELGAANAQNSITANMFQGLGNTANQLLSNKDVQSWLGGGSTPNIGTFDAFAGTTMR